MAARSEKITFANAAGDLLAARLDLPAWRRRAPSRCSPIASPAPRTSSRRRASARAWPRAASRCCASTSPASAPARASSATATSPRISRTWWLRPTSCVSAHQAPMLLVGHSLGGAAVLAAAQRVPEAVAVATIAAPFDPAHVAHLLAPARAEIEAEGEAAVVTSAGAASGSGGSSSTTSPAHRLERPASPGSRRR